MSILKLTKLIGLLSSTIQAVLPARLQFQYLQQQQLTALKETQSYNHKVVLGKLVLVELKWWIENLNNFNGRFLIQPTAQLVLQTDASLDGWGPTVRVRRRQANGP